ncbi:uncharacterized protein LOC131605745 [Vicia villosa]|uniref:uncharacterized protein LOC131605745 n=1 Tax=Vicia villosa TaxID=3911 RepID=UPI00273CC714|nr:uncharacterized protein LOC131605745 [Vicia villosa]
MGFGEKWRKWMEMLVFSSNMSVLVNGSPTKEFKVHKGLRQGDPLSPFLFVLVVEGLSGLVKKSIQLGEFQNYSFNANCKVDILQFADDTLLVGEGSWKHLWAVRAVLRAFEIVSGLGINYNKSKLIGINTNEHFLEAASNFLSCKVEESNFYFLGIPIGFNPRKEATWKPLLLKMRNRLEGWSNRFLNLGGRITLLKSVLSSLCIFTMSFYKMPKKVVKLFTSVQSRFLWGDMEDKRFLREAFPDLFFASRLKKVSVAAMGGWLEYEWRWGDLGLPGSVMDDSALRGFLLSLKNRLKNFNGWSVGKDTVVWNGNVEREFSVASCYEQYEKSFIPYGPQVKHAEVFDLLWVMDAPFKIKAFGWRLFHNRLPTKDLLENRGMSLPSEDLKCIFCGISKENRDHLFFGCLVVKNIWNDIAFWVGKGVCYEEECLSSFMDWHMFFHSKLVLDRKSNIIWFATTWCLWLVRNGVCFRKEAWSVNNVVWNIKLLAWRWSFCGKITQPNYSFYEFSKEPLYYIS